jgi:hypothetical protein
VTTRSDNSNSYVSLFKRRLAEKMSPKTGKWPYLGTGSKLSKNEEQILGINQIMSILKIS